MRRPFLLAALLLAILATTLAGCGAADSAAGLKLALLTFDDGPHPDYTPAVLDILAGRDIRALFFVVGRAVDSHPDLARRLVAAGHTLGNHTYDHHVITGRDRDWLARQVLDTGRAIASATGQSTSLFRPPLGLISQPEAAGLASLGQSVLLWDYGLEKAAIPDPPDLVAHLLGRIRPGQNRLVLLLHDGDPDGRHPRHATVAALPLLLDALRQRGYACVDPAGPAGQALIAGRLQPAPPR